MTIISNQITGIGFNLFLRRSATTALEVLFETNAMTACTQNACESMENQKLNNNSNSFQRHYQRFVDHTTIHGFRDMFYATPKIVKFIWFVIVVICISGAFYQISIMAVNYNSQPTTSHIYWEMKPRYRIPVVTFCPAKWVNFSAAKELGLTNYTMMALKKAAFGIDGDDNDFSMVANNLDQVLFKRKINLIQLYYAISNKWNRYLECRKCVRVTEIYQQNNGICYQFHFPFLSNKRLTVTSLVDLVFSYKDPTVPLDPEFEMFNSVLELPKIAIGEAAVSSVAFDSARLKLNRAYQLKIHVKTIKKLNKLSDPCREAGSRFLNLTFKFASVDACALNCSGYVSGPFYHFCLLCDNLRRKTRGTVTFKSSNHPCETNTWKTTGNDSEQCNNIRNYTFENCTLSPECYPPSCDFYLYDYSLMVLSEYKSNTTVHIFFRPIEGIETVKEVYTYSWETFLSNIGGQLGLWLGASVVSFFQILYYCFHYCCTRNEWKRSSTYRNKMNYI